MDSYIINQSDIELIYLNIKENCRLNSWDVDVFSFNLLMSKFSCKVEFWIKEWNINSGKFFKKYKNYFNQLNVNEFEFIQRKHKTEWDSSEGRNRSYVINKSMYKVFEFEIELNNVGKEYDKFGLSIINDGFIEEKRIGFNYNDEKYFNEIDWRNKIKKTKININKVVGNNVESSTLNKYFIT